MRTRERQSPEQLEARSPFTARPRRRIGTLVWTALLGAALVAGGLLAAVNSETARQAREIFALPNARLAIQITPDGPFQVAISTTAAGGGKVYDGSQAISVEPGDYYVDVVPLSRELTPKKLKVHLGANQMLALPVVLQPKSR